MPVNDFEKQVQHKMEELKLHPAEQVWEKIEKEISKKKRKKRFLFILSLMAGLLLLGYLGYRYFTPLINGFKFGKNTSSTSEIITRDSIINEGNNERVTGTITIPASTLPDQQKIVSIEKELTRDKTSSANGIVKGGLHEVGTQVSKNRSMQTQNSPPILNKNPASESKNLFYKNDDPSTDLTGRNTEAIKTNDPGVMVKKDQAANDRSVGLQKEVIINNKEKVSDASAGTTNSVNSKSKTEAQQKMANQKAAKDSRLGLSFSAGVSDIRKKLLSFSQSSLQTADNGGFLTGSPGAASNRVLPSETQPGIVVKLGVTWEKDITKRSKFSTGLQYAYISDRINVGGRTNAALRLSYGYLSNQSINGYYAGTQQNKFTNRYHFIELPVGFQFQLNKSSHVPFTWNLGVSLGRLITTNALVYDTARGGIYYHSRELFNQTHFSFLNGLLFRFKGRKGMALSIGPQWSIDMTSTIRKGYDKSRFLLAGYLEARLLFPGKSKK